jgi:hypothetical protein
MLDRGEAIKALTRMAAGLFLISLYVFMLLGISTQANQAIIWLTTIISIAYSVLPYRKLNILKTVAAAAGTAIPKAKWPEAMKMPFVGVVLILIYYFLNPALAQVFYLLAGLWLFFNGQVRVVLLIIRHFAGSGRQETSMTRTVVAATILTLIDIFMLGSFYIAAILAAVVVPLKLVKATRLHGEGLVNRQRLVEAGIYTVAAVLIITAFILNNHLAQQRTKVLAVACEQYKVKYGEYPTELAELLPEFMKEIPTPKIGIFPDRFKYVSCKERHAIMYVKLPPYGRSYYTMETKKWGFID